jgi:ATP/maltotriose-dependent transcriptional regulator MalT
MHGMVLGGEEVPMLTTEVDLPKLTRRQREVLSLLVGGKSNKDIARVLHIAQATTKITHGCARARARRAQSHGGRFQSR